MKRTTKFVARTAIICALYTALTFVFGAFSYGPIQVRVSEALTILPLFCVEAIPALALGCFLSNIPMGIWDMIIGTFATLLASVLTRYSRKFYWGVIPPVVINALLVPLIFLTMPGVSGAYWFNALTVGLGQAISVCGLGIPLYFALKKADQHYPKLFN
ncbi:MAG: QueT transporter family protein [Clostridia bacterium]|nr:QueT transporter family protein [Clostridia bacterium]